MKAPDGLFHDPARGLPRPAGECDDLRPDLFLYAEGELECPSSLLRIRRHLRGCPACQDRLGAHDALTREILAEGFAEVPGLLADDSRADRIMDLILAGASSDAPGWAPPQDSAEAFAELARGLRLEAPPPPAAARGLPRAVVRVAAAAALVGVGFLAALLLPSRPDVDPLARLDGETGRTRLASVRRQGPAPTLVSSRGDSPDTVPATEPRPLWIALPRDRALEALPPDFPVRLLGFRAEPCDGTPGSLALEWVVEAVIDERPSSGRRVFLVPEGNELTAVEIAPRAWIERSRSLHDPAEVGGLVRGRPAEGERAYHAYVLEEPGSLGEVLPAPVLGSSRPFLPGEVSGVAPREWVLPARWKN